MRIPGRCRQSLARPEDPRVFAHTSPPAVGPPSPRGWHNRGGEPNTRLPTKDCRPRNSASSTPDAPTYGPPARSAPVAPHLEADRQILSGTSSVLHCIANVATRSETGVGTTGLPPSPPRSSWLSASHHGVAPKGSRTRGPSPPTPTRSKRVGSRQGRRRSQRGLTIPPGHRAAELLGRFLRPQVALRRTRREMRPSITVTARPGHGSHVGPAGCRAHPPPTHHPPCCRSAGSADWPCSARGPGSGRDAPRKQGTRNCK